MTRGRSPLLLLVLIAVLVAQATFAAEKKRDVDFDFYAWSRAAGTTAPGADAKVRFGGGVSVDGPLAIGDGAPLDVGLALDVESLPDKGKFSWADLGTWGSYFETRTHLQREVGRFKVSGGTVRTYAVIFGGATFKGLGAQELGQETRRALRHYAVGFTLEHESAKGARSWFRVGWGTDGAVGPVKWREVLFRFSVVLKGAVSLDGRGGLGFGAASAAGLLVDFFTAGIRVAIDELITRP